MFAGSDIFVTKNLSQLWCLSIDYKGRLKKSVWVATRLDVLALSFTSFLFMNNMTLCTLLEGRLKKKLMASFYVHIIRSSSCMAEHFKI